MTGKLATPEEAVAEFVPDGTPLLAVGGMHMHNNPMALVMGLVHSGRRAQRLLTSPSGGLGADVLIGAGVIDEVATSYIGFEHLGLAPCFRRRVEAGSLRVLELDEPSISHGLYAGAAGIPFVPLPLGLELAEVAAVNPEWYRFVDDPFAGGRHLAVPAIRPDVALLHAGTADPHGNAVLAGAHFTDRLMALAARRVILQVERVVEPGSLSAGPQGNSIPGFLVDAVVEAPGGCRPTASHGHYPYDEPALRVYLAAARDEAGFSAFVANGLAGSGNAPR